jgi:hypothetical protein
MRMLERDQTYNDVLDRIERLEMRIGDLRDMGRPSDEMTFENPDWQVVAGWVSTGTVLQDVNGRIVLDPTVPCIRVDTEVHLGNLIGLADYTEAAYGIFIGDYAGDNWMAYDPTNGLRIRGDAVIEGTITADKLNIGNSLFNSADGLLLLGPHCYISPTEWHSLRKQKATLSGGFHTMQGMWLGTRGLMIEEATTNLIINPSLETNTTGWTPVGATTFTRTQDRVAVAGDYVATVVFAAAARFERDVTVQTAAATAYTFSVYVCGSTAETIALGIWDDVTGYSWGSAESISGGWKRISVTKTFGAGSASRYVEIVGSGACTIYFDAFQLEQKAYATSYCDGTLGYGYAWTGTAHASTSTRAVNECNLDAHAGLISEKDTLSFRLVVQAAYDADATWPSPCGDNTFMDAWGAGAFHRIASYYSTSDDTVTVLIQCGAVTITLKSGVQTFVAGEWLDIIFTLDFTSDSYKLYVNGVLEDTDTTACDPIALQQWNLGSTYFATQQMGAGFCELGVFGRILDQHEISQLFQLQQPLVDSGSTEGPGIYILDGSFRIASSTSGTRIEITAAEIAGYDAAGTKQFYLQASDGLAYAGGGNVIMSSGGIVVKAPTSADTQREIRWRYDDSGTLRTAAYVYGSYGLATSESFGWVVGYRAAGDPWGGARVVHSAYDAVDTEEAFVDLRSQYEIVGIGDNMALCPNQSPTSTMLGAGAGVFSITNCITVPTVNYASGGILYAQAGALKWRGSAGTVTTIAPAEPHCPVCGRDFMLEWVNEAQETSLQVCVWCLCQALEGTLPAGVVTKRMKSKKVHWPRSAKPVQAEARPRL